MRYHYFTFSLMAALVFPSCAGLEDTPQMAKFGGAAGAAAGALIGSQSGRGGAGRGALIGGAAGVLAGTGLSMAYKYSADQKRDAQESVNRALANDRSIMSSVKSGKNYVAVSVPKDKNDSESKPGVVRVKVDQQPDGSYKAGSADSTYYSSAREAQSHGDTVYYAP